MNKLHRLVGGIALSAAIQCVAMAGTLPFPPQMVEPVQPNQLAPDGSARLGIAVAGDDATANPQVRLGAVTVCSETACYRSASKSSVDLHDTRAGRAESIVEMAIPFTSVKSVHFERAAGNASVSGDIRLDPPLEIPSDFKGGKS